MKISTFFRTDMHKKISKSFVNILYYKGSWKWKKHHRLFGKKKLCNFKVYFEAKT